MPTHTARTKAPWRRGGTGAHVALVSSLIDITAPLVPPTDRPDAARLAGDASLIAAAPALHDALSALVDAVESLRLSDRDERTIWDALTDAKSALRDAHATQG